MGSGLNNAEVADVYRQYGHLLLRRCRLITRDDALAEDALQEAFVRVMRYGRGLHEARSKLLSVLNAPATKLVRTLAEPHASLVRVVDARRAEMEGAA